jgi:NAD(P)-dependent dehydrogenase (short-subunit alcohol dehydrogenase family)
VAVADLAGQTAVITGATGGIGRSVALALARRGVHLRLLVRDKIKGASLVAELASVAPGVRLDIHEVDLSKDIRPAVERLLKDDPAVDILVHAAGALSLGRFADFDAQDFDLQFQVNARAPLTLTQLLLPLIRKRPGQIVFLNSSVTRQETKADVIGYAASKYALKSIADGIRNAVNDDGIRVLSVYPGRTATPMQERVFAFESRTYRGDRLLQPDDVAETIVAALVLPRTAELTDVFVRPSRKPTE